MPTLFLSVIRQFENANAVHDRSEVASGIVSMIPASFIVIDQHNDVQIFPEELIVLRQPFGFVWLTLCFLGRAAGTTCRDIPALRDVIGILFALGNDNSGIKRGRDQ